jgi:hypothetical protein
MAQDIMNTNPNTMNCIDKVGLKVLPYPAMLKGVQIDCTVKISALNDISDEMSDIDYLHLDALHMSRS